MFIMQIMREYSISANVKRFISYKRGLYEMDKTLRVLPFINQTNYIALNRCVILNSYQHRNSHQLLDSYNLFDLYQLLDMQHNIVFESRSLSLVFIAFLITYNK